MKPAPFYYIDSAGEHRWHVRGDNGEIIDASTEGFSSRDKAEENYRLGFEAAKEHFNE